MHLSTLSILQQAGSIYTLTTPGDCQIVKKATYNFLGVKAWPSLLSGKVGE